MAVHQHAGWGMYCQRGYLRITNTLPREFHTFWSLAAYLLRGKLLDHNRSALLKKRRTGGEPMAVRREDEEKEEVGFMKKRHDRC